MLFLFSLHAGCVFKCLHIDYDTNQTVSFAAYKLEIETLNQQTRLLREPLVSTGGREDS